MKAELFSKDTLDFLRLLAKHEVRYLLIRGTAVHFHGYPRLTGDVDFLYHCEQGNVTRLWAALQEFWGGRVPAIADPRELEDPSLVVQFGRPPNRIDLIANLDSVPFEQAWASRVRESVVVGSERVPVTILGLADLRRSKRVAGRPKDLDDLAHLPEA